MDTLFSHVSVVTMDARMSVWIDAFVGVTDGKISWLAKKAPEEQPQKIIDGSGMVLMPLMRTFLFFFSIARLFRSEETIINMNRHSTCHCRPMGRAAINLREWRTIQNGFKNFFRFPSRKQTRER